MIKGVHIYDTVKPTKTHKKSCRALASMYIITMLNLTKILM